MGNSTGKVENIDSLGKQADKLMLETDSLRNAIVNNENALKKNISEKAAAEAALNTLLRKRFAEEKAVLSSVKRSASRKQASLKQTISFLERINKLYEEKQSRISEAKKKHTNLKKMLAMLERQAGELKSYA